MLFQKFLKSILGGCGYERLASLPSMDKS